MNPTTIVKRVVLLRRIGCALLLVTFLLHASASKAAMNLAEAIATAQRNDPWVQGSEFRQQAVAAQAVVAGTLPDPMVDLAFANLPTDTFDFDQEAMTQFKVGVVQTFPRGDSRALSQRRLNLLGEQFPYQRDERRARLSVTVTKVWLEAWRAKESIRLIEDDRELFEHLVDVAQSSYATAVGRTRQQDLVRAQLELTRLEDRLSVLYERLDTSRSKLGEWLRTDSPASAGGQGVWDAYAAPQLTQQLPDIRLQHTELYRDGSLAAP